MRQDIYIAPNPEFTHEFDLMRNDADSSYNALQVQYRHRLAYGLQTFALLYLGAFESFTLDLRRQ